MSNGEHLCANPQQHTFNLDRVWNWRKERLKVINSPRSASEKGTGEQGDESEEFDAYVVSNDNTNNNNNNNDTEDTSGTEEVDEEEEEEEETVNNNNSAQ